MSQQANNNDIEWLIGILTVVFFILLYLFREQVGSFFMTLRYWQAYLLPSSFSDPVFDWVIQTSPIDVNFDDIVGSGNAVGKFWRFPVAIILGIMGYKLYSKKASLKKKYRKVHNRNSLMIQESNEWNVIKPIIGMDLVNVSLDHPIEGMRQIPREWGKRHKVLFSYDTHSHLLASEENNPIVSTDGKDIILLDVLKRELESQVGRPWEGYEKLKRHEKSLFIAFCAQIRGDTIAAQIIINELAVNFCTARENKDIKLIYSATAEEIAVEVLGDNAGEGDDNKFDRLAVKKIQQACLNHAYVRTTLMTLILMARKNGKLPPNWFRWLKTTDRITWYALCDLGLDEEDMPSSIDSAGVRSHWLWERRSRSALPDLQVQQAFNGFILEINTRMENPNDNEDAVDALSL